MPKGTISKYLNGENVHLDNLNDDYVGHIDLGHMDFPTFPFVLGTWEKKDLSVVDTVDGRQALNISPSIDEDSIFIKELRKMPYSLGISAEFNVHFNEEMTEEVSKTLGEYVPAYDEIYIKGFGIVGDAGNVNSGNVELKERQMADESIKVELSVEETETEQVEETEVEEETLAVNEEVESEVGEVEEVECEAAVDEEAEAEEAEDEEDDAYERLSAKIDALIAENKELNSKLAVYEEKLKRQGRKLKAQAEKVESFNEKFPTLSVSMGLSKEEDNNKEARPVRYKTGDGIGEL